jgi:tRNA threonylcarbamoyladenosine biosynthesis protein TsaB
MSHNKIVMGIETSSRLCSIAWWEEGNVLLEYNVEQKNQHAQLLPALAEKGFQYLGIEKNSVNLVAVSAGPGSFTGLRIGMAYAKGFCYALDRQLVAVTNFELMKSFVRNENRLIYTIIDTHREKLYRSVFCTENSTKVRSDIIDWAQLIKEITENTIIIMEERAIIPEGIKIKIPVLSVRISGATVCRVGYLKKCRGHKQNLDEIEPFYLQKFAGLV